MFLLEHSAVKDRMIMVMIQKWQYYQQNGVPRSEASADRRGKLVKIID